LASWLATSLDLMEALLTGRRWLQGGAFGIADCVAFPFIKYALLPPAEDDPDTFHEVLSRYLVLLPRHSGLREWIERIDAMPRGGHALPG
jgi:glutathione S-transferase